jgi:hypothetical protein
MARRGDGTARITLATLTAEEIARLPDDALRRVIRRAHRLLVRIRFPWESLSEAQRAEVSTLRTRAAVCLGLAESERYCRRWRPRQSDPASWSARAWDELLNEEET